MQINLKWRIKLFSEKSNVELFTKLIEYYVNLSKSLNFKPILLILPQKDDVSYIKKNSHFYQNVIDQLEKFTSLEVIDGTTSILKIKNIDEIYSDQNEYGGHFFKEGNEIVASLLNKFFNKNIF